MTEAVAAVIPPNDPTEADRLDHARAVLETLTHLAYPKRPELEGLTDEEFLAYVNADFAEQYEEILPPKIDDVAQPSPLNAENMTALIGPGPLDFEPAYEATTKLIIPGTNIQMFVGGGSFAVFNMEGKGRLFQEKRIGLSYENDYNSAPYTVTKPLAALLLHHLGETPEIENQQSSDMICGALGMERGGFHMGNVMVELPTGPDGAMEKGMMGISCVELTPEALAYFLGLLKESGAEHSIDTFMDGFYTGAGFLDELAGKVVEAKLKGASDEDLQAIADSEWKRLIDLAIPGPLPDQCN